MKITNFSAALAQRLRLKGRAAASTAAAAILSGGLVLSGAAEAATLFSEDFEGVTPLLGPFVSSTETGGSGSDWASLNTAQANGQLTGWSLDLTTTPADGVTEFQGWSFLAPASWAATAGQDRDKFTKGKGTIAVADGDEYDDSAGNTVGGNNINVFLLTPAIDLTTAPSGAAVKLTFDSSFRPYDAQTGLVDVSFDGGATFGNLLTLDTASTPGGTSSLSRVDETVMLDLNAPSGSSSAIVRFGYTGADNDWWWAIDNISVDAVPEPGAAALAGLAVAGAAASGRRRRD